MPHGLLVLCNGHCHSCPSVVVVLIGLNTQLDLALTVSCHLHQRCTGRPPAAPKWFFPVTIYSKIKTKSSTITA